MSFAIAFTTSQIYKQRLFYARIKEKQNGRRGGGECRNVYSTYGEKREMMKLTKTFGQAHDRKAQYIYLFTEQYIHKVIL